MKNTWRISKLDRLLKLLRTVSLKLRLTKIGKLKLQMNGIELPKWKLNKLELLNRLKISKINAVYILIVSNKLFYLMIIFILFIGSGTLSRKSRASQASSYKHRVAAAKAGEGKPDWDKSTVASE